MARTYKRDSRGRFAGGGGSSGGGNASAKPKASGKASGKPKASAKPKANAKPATSGKPSGGGRKRNKSFVTTTGTFATRIRAKLAQKARTKRFSSKATGPGRDAKAEYKKRAGEARKAARSGDARSIGRTSKPNVSFAAMERRLKKVSDSAILERREKADMLRDEMAYRSGQIPKSKKKRDDYSRRSTQAEMNRRQNSLITAQRAREFLAAAAQFPSNFSLRPRYSTGSAPRNRPLPSMTSYFSAWRGYSYKPSKPRRR